MYPITFWGLRSPNYHLGFRAVPFCAFFLGGVGNSFKNTKCGKRGTLIIEVLLGNLAIIEKANLFFARALSPVTIGH